MKIFACSVIPFYLLDAGKMNYQDKLMNSVNSNFIQAIFIMEERPGILLFIVCSTSSSLFEAVIQGVSGWDGWQYSPLKILGQCPAYLCAAAVASQVAV